ncbi:MFS transporter, SP family, sugar:H+ symporter [Galdieria sulphuraria]|uniref:MFS transporter, SP family, sugar:H+ symporter n=1 Tax=Galdieria sulphuraria TaxID=130081 RepID=M2VTD3_GALSU|nr:MFS transporter, SP family, sugar:H+ symporter [Galdieria sulphuraria]EME26456.1 MFS transporter, SP family, sugar:H+ symporter [Galdieria sulphuraria]|eukprot:XP_005702976.1 MFS transporter, SP family, sugar:H+ symporter [Galdieria sulphuraria]
MSESQLVSSKVSKQKRDEDEDYLSNTEMYSSETVEDGEKETVQGPTEEELQAPDLQRKGWDVTCLTKNPKNFAIMVGVLSSVGAVLYGLDVSLISGVLLFVVSDLNLTSHQSSLVSSGMALGAIGGGFLGIVLVEYIGRKRSILIACVLYTVGALMEALSPSFGVLISGRLVLGLGVGIEYDAIPLYISESSPKNRRGDLVALFQLMAFFGVMLGYVVDAIFANVSGSWRFMFGSSIVFSVAYFLLMLVFPESPRWLMKRGRERDALRNWKYMRGFAHEERLEYVNMVEIVQTELELSRRRNIWLDFIRVPELRYAVVYAILMIFLQQFSGVNSIEYYLGTLYEDIGMSKLDSVYMSLINGGCLFISTLPAVFLMDKVGRRPLVLLLAPFTVIGLAIAGASTYIKQKKGHVAAYTLGMVIYDLFWGSALGAVPIAVNSEVYPQYLRTNGMSIAVIATFVGTFTTTYTFSRMVKSMTQLGTLLGFYGGVTFVGWATCILFMPETKDLTLEQVRQVFLKGPFGIAKENKRILSRQFSNAKNRVKSFFGISS